MKLSAEKRMRKHLIEEIKKRKVFGARIAETRKTAEDLQQLNLAPQVYLYKNMMTGQVLYSQVPGYHQNQIDEQFARPNWENRKPSRRNDLWRIMAVATFDSYDKAIGAFNGLLQLRSARDIELRAEAKAMRRKNNDGNIWFNGNYRPTYSQEAVADLSHVIDEFNLVDTKVYWENIWRKGEEKHWRTDLVEHEEIPAFNPKHSTVMLDELRIKALEEFEKLRESVVEEEQIQGQVPIA